MSDVCSVSGGLALVEKWTDPVMVVSVSCQDLRNVPSRIWMVRDWIRRQGYRAVGMPSCLFGAKEGSPDPALCEVQWAVEGAAPDADAELCVKILPAMRVISALHSDATLSLSTTLQAIRDAAAAHGYTVAGPHREVYHLNGGDHGQWAIEVEIPVAPSVSGT